MESLSIVVYLHPRGEIFSFKCLPKCLVLIYICISAMVDLRCIALEDFGLFLSHLVERRSFVRCGVRKLIETA